MARLTKAQRMELDLYIGQYKLRGVVRSYYALAEAIRVACEEIDQHRERSIKLREMESQLK